MAITRGVRGTVSPVSTYLLFGIPLLLVALAAFAGAWQLFRR
jgi:hypothetical protein